MYVREDWTAAHTSRSRLIRRVIPETIRLRLSVSFFFTIYTCNSYDECVCVWCERQSTRVKTPSVDGTQSPEGGRGNENLLVRLGHVEKKSLRRFLFRRCPIIVSKYQPLLFHPEKISGWYEVGTYHEVSMRSELLMSDNDFTRAWCFYVTYLIM